VIWTDTRHPPGIIGVIGQETARYHAFTAHWSVLETPYGCGQSFGMSYDVSINSNSCIRAMLAEPRFKWVWIMDDDHVFAPSTLLTLLDAQVDLIVPLYAQRKPPLLPCLYAEETSPGRYRNFTWRELAGASGIMPVVSAGKGGVLIRRHVVEKMPAPWFERGSDGSGEDHYFYKKARGLGIPLYCHLGVPLGHITTHVVRVKHEGDRWNPVIDLGQGCAIDVFPESAEESERDAAMVEELWTSPRG
jgi:hypothetical protein